MSKFKNPILYFTLSMLLISSCGTLNSGRLKYRKLNNNATAKEKTIVYTHNEIDASQISELAPTNASLENDYSENTISKSTVAKVPLIDLSTKDTLTKNNCDVLLMKDGKEINVKIIEIGPDFIKYKRCEFLEGPFYSVKSSDAKSITYSNGTKEDVKEEVAKENKPPGKQRTQTAGLILGIVGLTLGLLIAMAGNPLFFIGAVFGFIAILLAVNSFVALKKKPDSQIGRKLGAASLFFGILSLGAPTIMFLGLFFF